MNPKEWIEQRATLLRQAEDEHSHILDRIDAYLELSQLYQRDDHMRAVFVDKARTLIRKEQQ